LSHQTPHGNPPAWSRVNGNYTLLIKGLPALSPSCRTTTIVLGAPKSASRIHAPPISVGTPTAGIGYTRPPQLPLLHNLIYMRWKQRKTAAREALATASW
jgi:hypothetical protein